MSEQDQLGVRTLKLLDAEWTVAVLRGLDAGVQRPAELERRLRHAGHSTVMRRLRRLLDSGLLSYEHQPGLPPRAHSAGIPHEAHYSLTDAGRALLGVIEEADRWGRTWCSGEGRRDPDGTLAIKFTSDRHVRTVMLLLADGPLDGADLEGRISGIGRSALRRRLHEMVLAGLLEQRGRGRVRSYELTDRARHLALLALLAARWESRWWEPECPALGGDLDGLLRLLAPAIGGEEALLEAVIEALSAALLA
ncbi:MAG: winged helix-turn-helix transcriptional regulator [Solirubrobacteraceae bacterium]